MNTLLCILIIFHGLIPMAAFVNALHLAPVNQLTQNITKVNGILWLTAALLFIITAIPVVLGKDSRWMMALSAIIISQYLVCTSGHDAKNGSVVNVIVLVTISNGYGMDVVWW